MKTVYVDYYGQRKEFVISDNGRSVNTTSWDDFKKEFLRAYQGMQVEPIFRLITTDQAEISRLLAHISRDKLDMTMRVQRGCSNFNARSCSESISCPAYCEW